MFKRMVVFRINATIVFVYIGEVVWMNFYNQYENIIQHIIEYNH